MGERFDGFFRFRFLNVAEYRVDDKDKHNDDGVERQYFAAFRAWRSVGFFDEPCDERDAGGSEQQVDEGVFELRQELLPFWHGWCGCELVRPVLRESAFSFGLAQTGVRIDAKRCGHGLRVGKRRVDLWRLLVLLILPNLRAIARSGIAVKIGMGLDGLIFLAIIHGDLLGSAAE